ncbi:MAG: helix-turn-helix domain-containing protein [Paludibacter sp.]|nr:helix-turn-helix domain-containing protein [Paludibacter sp.]
MIKSWEKILAFTLYMKKKHITQEQRYTIYCLHKQGCTQKFIAETIGKDKSVISRELYVNFIAVKIKLFYVKSKISKNALFFDL